METVATILRRKGAEVYSIDQNATAREALGLMARENIGAVLVSQDGLPVGIFSERDYVRKLGNVGSDPLDVAVSCYMTRNVCCVRPDQSIEQAMSIMTEKRCRHLPVMDEGGVVGLISIGDAVKSIISEQEFVIDQLVSYIRGG